MRTIFVSRDAHKRLTYLKIDMNMRRIDEVIQLLLNSYEKKDVYSKVLILIGRVSQKQNKTSSDVIDELKKRLNIRKSFDEFTKKI